MDEAASPPKPRSSSRICKERRREGGNKKNKADVGRLDALAFARRAKYLREVFLDLEKRHTYEWTAVEKKVLALDWFHNPGEYKSWAPSETEDMSCRLFSNLIFNYSHLAMINIGSSVIVCRLINEFVDIGGNYQLICIIVRSEIGEETVQDSLRIGLIYRGEQTEETLDTKQMLIYKASQSHDFQCLCEGLSFNIHSGSKDEFNIYKPCEVCDHRKIEMRTQLLLPEVCFKAHLVGLEVTSAIVDGRRNYLAAVQKVDGTVHLIDITRMIQVTLEVINQWKVKYEEYVKMCKGSFSKENAISEPKDKEASHKGSSTSKGRKVKKRCTGCLLQDTDLKKLDEIRKLTLDFTLPAEPILCQGLDVSEEPYSGIPIRRISHETCLSFVYTSIESLNVVIPIYVVAVGGSKVCVWYIGDVNDGTAREPLMVMQLPDGIRPTDLTATLGIAKDYNSLLAGKFVHEPIFYTSDNAGYLRLWSITSKKCESAIQIDTNALLSVDVNMMYPNMIAIGVETGKIKIYNIWKQCWGVTGQPADIDFIRMTTIPSYLPNNVYEYLKWYHPVVKVKWVNDTFLLAQYAEPLYSKESVNASTVAIWNLAKDIFDRSDAILCHRTWSQEVANSWHLASRLLCLYGGHISSLSGVISSDCKWSSEHGLVAISSDATGQLHVYKPGIWTWADYDDGLCLARFQGNVDFHQRILDKVKQTSEGLINRQPADSRDAMASSNLRKHRGRFSDFVESAQLQLDILNRGGKLLNDYVNLPNWVKRTLKLNTETEKLLRQIHKNLREREIQEHISAGTTATS